MENKIEGRKWQLKNNISKVDVERQNLKNLT
jgi:hypothetical protein